MNIKLLRKIQRAIKKEPMRFTMNSWLNNSSRIAPCGTAACLAGHAVLLSSKKAWREAGLSTMVSRIDIPGRAKKLLKLTHGQSVRLFFMGNWPDKFQFCDDSACARIEHFIKTKGKE